MSGKSYYYMNELWRRQTLLTWCRRVLAVMNPLENEMTTELETMLGCSTTANQLTQQLQTYRPSMRWSESMANQSNCMCANKDSRFL